MKLIQPNQNRGKTESGAVLVVCLVLLMAMTLLAITSSSSTITDLQLTQNAVSRNRNFQVAETAIWTILNNGDCITKARLAENTYVDCTSLIFDPHDSTLRNNKALLRAHTMRTSGDSAELQRFYTRLEAKTHIETNARNAIELSVGANRVIFNRP